MHQFLPCYPSRQPKKKKKTFFFQLFPSFEFYYLSFTPLMYMLIPAHLTLIHTNIVLLETYILKCLKATCWLFYVPHNLYQYISQKSSSWPCLKHKNINYSNKKFVVAHSGCGFPTCPRHFRAFRYDCSDSLAYQVKSGRVSNELLSSLFFHPQKRNVPTVDQRSQQRWRCKENCGCSQNRLWEVHLRTVLSQLPCSTVCSVVFKHITTISALCLCFKIGEDSVKIFSWLEFRLH